ncbi:MAG: four-helix bundle copper-binding protein [Gemmatimonadota bacterium]
MNRLHSMLETHPEPAGPNGDEALRCIEACAECAETCTVCADACLGEDEVQHMVACIRLNLDCAEVCGVTGTLMARPSHRDAPALRAQLQACIEICRACGDECARHGGKMEHCRICAESCRACAEACEAMAGALVP